MVHISSLSIIFFYDSYCASNGQSDTFFNANFIELKKDTSHMYSIVNFILPSTSMQNDVDFNPKRFAKQLVLQTTRFFDSVVVVVAIT